MKQLDNSQYCNQSATTVQNNVIYNKIPLTPDIIKPKEKKSKNNPKYLTV